MKPRIFVASSVEHVDLAYAVQEGLEHDAEVTVWSQGVFKPSRTAMASLVDALNETHFAVFVLAPDDVSAIRGTTRSIVRDNVIFELGLFAGRLGHERCYLVVPRGSEDLHLPTDLIGLTHATFEPNRQDGNMVAALGPACNRIRQSFTGLWRASESFIPKVQDQAATHDLTDDPDDCVAYIQSWLGQRTPSENSAVIRFSDVDRELRLAPGSARAYIKQAAVRWSYVVEREGKDTIMFRSNYNSSSYF